jgi:hypothetical protein
MISRMRVRLAEMQNGLQRQLAKSGRVAVPITDILASRSVPSDMASNLDR